MLRIIEIGEGQALVDVAMQYCGNAEKQFEVAELNGLSITEDIIPGTSLFVPDLEIENKKVFAAFNDNQLWPASKEEDWDGNLLDGIDYWIIEEDFIIQ